VKKIVLIIIALFFLCGASKDVSLEKLREKLKLSIELVHILREIDDAIDIKCTSVEQCHVLDTGTEIEQISCGSSSRYKIYSLLKTDDNLIYALLNKAIEVSDSIARQDKIDTNCSSISAPTVLCNDICIDDLDFKLDLEYSENSKKIQALIADARCEFDHQCQVIARGEKACGGLKFYDVYSTAITDEKAIIELARRDREIAHNITITKRNNTLSDCELLMPPKTKCNKKCIMLVE